MGEDQRAVDTLANTESFRGLLLRHRGRTGLSQRDLALRLGAGRRTVQDWEAGVNRPGAERLEALIEALLETGGLTLGCEEAEAQQMWVAVVREAPRMRTPFDEAWFERLLAARPASQAPDQARQAISSVTGTGVAEATPVERDQDWGTAPDVLGFVGRSEELATLREWVMEARCRLVAVLGMGGIGKTSLAAKLAEDLAPGFDRIYWRSLRDAPPVSEWLPGAIGFLSSQQLAPPAAEGEQLQALLQVLRERRSLLVLDNFETLLEPGDSEGRFRDGYDAYGRLVRAIGECRHQSCLVLTSREAPAELAVLGRDAVRSFYVRGLRADDAQVLLAPKHLAGSNEHWGELTTRLSGNSLALKMIGESIREFFGGDVGTFLQEDGAVRVCGGIRRLLAEQVERSSAAERQVLRVLAVEREPVTVPELLAALGPRLGRAALLDALDSLRRRSLVERTETPAAAGFTLQSVVLEYVTDRLVESVADEDCARPTLAAR